jgi:hypothetical protein
LPSRCSPPSGPCVAAPATPDGRAFLMDVTGTPVWLPATQPT